MFSSRCGVLKRFLSRARIQKNSFLFAAVFVSASLHAGTQHAKAPDQSPQVKASALQQIAVLRSIKTNKNSREQKIGSRLFLGLLHARGDQRLQALPDFRFVQPDADGLVEVQVITKAMSGMKRVQNELGRVRATVSLRSRTQPYFLARVPLAALEDIAALDEVRFIRQPLPAMTNAVNTSEGDLAHGAAQARGLFGSNGAGVKICVLSDGVNSLAALQASGDLPAVDVLPNQAGSGDEGSAMLEIVHDLAPGAELGFATAFESEDGFAQNILDLAADGCDVIVDDILWLDESPFQDSLVAQAVNTVTAAGVMYFSSAGNEGNKDDGTSGTWEGDFLASSAAVPVDLVGADLHDFGDGGNSIFVELAVGSDTPPLLIWAEHYDLVSGLASTDLDLYVMDGTLTTIFDAGIDVQNGVGGNDFPIEFVPGGTFSGERLLIDRFAEGATSSPPMFNLIVFRGELDDNLTTGGTTRGHSAAVNAYSVAATPAAASGGGTPDGPFPGSFVATNESEAFSSDGPRRLLLDSAGAELTPGNRTSSGGVVRQKPDVTAADGVATAAPGFDPFYGTSAAAPHAAAIAGLIKAAVPSITPAQVRTILTSTAIDIEAAGVDRSTGAGIIMAGPALQAAGAQPSAVLSMGAVAPAEIVGDGDAFIEINEDWSFSIPLQNAGTANATAISAKLTSPTPGVVMTGAISGYPDLAVSASSPNDIPFSIFVSPTAACGGAIEFNLEVSYTGGPASPQTFAHSTQIGGPGAPVVTSVNDAMVAIPDGGNPDGTMPGAPADSAIAVAGVGRVFHAALRIDGEVCNADAGSTTVGIDHSFVNDLDITLLSPAGTAVLAIDNTDGDGNNLCNTVLDDDSGGANIQSVVSAQAPFTGSFVPKTPFAVFHGEVADGNWILRAQDFFLGDTGTIRDWSIVITPAVCDAPPQTIALAATKEVSGGDLLPGGTVEYSVTITNTGTGLQPDNAGDEFVDLLPAGLTAGVPTATSGTVSGAGVNPVTWNGALGPGESVTVTIPASIAGNPPDMSPSNQGTASFDTDRDGSNESSVLTDDPNVGGASNPTVFDIVQQGALTIVPAVVAFADTAVGEVSAAQAVTLANSGNAPLDVTALEAPNAPFQRDANEDTCPAAAPFSLAPNASCTLLYAFAPTGPGLANTVLSIAANVPGGGDVSLTGNGVPGAITITPASLPHALIDTPYAVPLDASGTGTTEPFTFSHTGQLPAGLTLSAGGLLSGTPSELGAFNVTVTATDGSAADVGGPFSESIDYVLLVVDDFIFADGFETLEIPKFALKSMNMQQVALPVVSELATSGKNDRHPILLLTLKGRHVGVVEARCAASACEVRVVTRSGDAKWNAGPWWALDEDPYTVEIDAGAKWLRRVRPMLHD